VFITLVTKINAATIQISPLLIVHTYALIYTWFYLRAVTISVGAFNQVNAATVVILKDHQYTALRQ